MNNADPIRMMIVEDDPQLAKLLLRTLSTEGRALNWFADGAEAVAALDSSNPDIMLLDLGLPGLPGLEVLKAALANRRDRIVVILTGDAGERSVVEAMRLGAHDYLTKETPLEALEAKVEAAVSAARQNRQAHDGTGLQAESDNKGILVGRSSAMVQVFKQIGTLAASNVPVLIYGESGTGKEKVARALHAYGPRPDGPYVTVDCASIPANLFESELFGYEKGAFTGALNAKKGRFEEANGGTLFLDEIGNLAPESAAKLLRALQEKTSQRLGSNVSLTWDVRIVAATNVDLWAKARRGEYREDLVFRLSGAEIRLPPLRDRPGDLEVLIRHFLSRHSSADGEVSAEALALMKAYPWPGNVRELEHAVQRGLALARGQTVRPEHLSDAIREASPMARAGIKPAAGPDEVLSLEDVKRQYARYTLELFRGNRALTAKKLDVDPRTLASLIDPEI